MIQLDERVPSGPFLFGFLGFLLEDTMCTILVHGESLNRLEFALTVAYVTFNHVASLFLLYRSPASFEI
jgi:hypothetical protein